MNHPREGREADDLRERCEPGRTQHRVLLVERRPNVGPCRAEVAEDADDLVTLGEQPVAGVEQLLDVAAGEGAADGQRPAHQVAVCRSLVASIGGTNDSTADKDAAELDKQLLS